MSGHGSRGWVALFAAALGACAPDVPRDPVPEAMQFDPEATPPRVPEPTGLVVNAETGRIDFALAGTPVPEDCDEPAPFSAAECEFNRYLETLDGFPTVTPAAAPATAELDVDTLTFGENVVVVATEAPETIPEVTLGFDDESRRITLRPDPSWRRGETYWLGVRGYSSGVRARSGSDVVGSPTLALLKEEASLTCGATEPDDVDVDCPAFALLSEGRSRDAALETLFTLESIRAAYAAERVWERLAEAGLPKAEAAVVWGFPIHSASVAELDPSVGLVPRVTGASEIRVGVQGGVDPATVTPFVVRERAGSIVLMDLTAAAGNDLVGGFPRVSTRFEAGEIVISASQPLVEDHQYGLFMTRGLRDLRGVSLVPSPVSVLLTLRSSLLDDDGASAISSVSDADAALLESGRSELAALFDNPVIAPLTGITREELVYCFAFTHEAP